MRTCLINSESTMMAIVVPNTNVMSKPAPSNTTTQPRSTTAPSAAKTAETAKAVGKS